MKLIWISPQTGMNFLVPIFQDTMKKIAWQGFSVKSFCQLNFSRLSCIPFPFDRSTFSAFLKHTCIPLALPPCLLPCLPQKKKHLFALSFLCTFSKSMRVSKTMFDKKIDHLFCLQANVLDPLHCIRGIAVNCLSSRVTGKDCFFLGCQALKSDATLPPHF